MPIVAREGDSKPRQLPPAGTHVARCYSIIELGTQATAFGEKPQVMFSWELPNETAVFKEENGPQPFAVHKTYTLSLFEKASLTHDLEAWMGRQLTADERKGFDIAKFLGQPCLLTIVHKTVESGKTYANIGGVTALAKGMVCPKAVNPKVEYSLSSSPNSVYLGLPQWLQERIAKAQEWDRAPVEPASEENPFNNNDPGDPPF